MLVNIERVYHIRTLVKTGIPIWNTSNWRDKAGGYGIQEPFGALHIARISGDYYNVIGLPISRLYRELKKLGAI